MSKMLVPCKECGEIQKETSIVLSAEWDEKEKTWDNYNMPEVCEACWEKFKDTKYVNYCSVARRFAEHGKEWEVIRDRETYHPAKKQEVKCQVCKTGKTEHTIKDGSKDIYVCDKCYYCSKCGSGQAIAKGLVYENKTLYQGSICEPCINHFVSQEKQGINVNSSTKLNNTSSTAQQAPDSDQQQPPKKSYLPWIIVGGLGIGAIVGLVIWLTTRKGEPKDN